MKKENFNLTAGILLKKYFPVVAIPIIIHTALIVPYWKEETKPLYLELRNIFVTNLIWFIDFFFWFTQMFILEGFTISSNYHILISLRNPTHSASIQAIRIIHYDICHHIRSCLILGCFGISFAMEFTIPNF